MATFRQISIILLICFFICPLIVAPFLLDQHLTIRSFILCIGLLTTLYLLVKSEVIIHLKVDGLLLTKIVYTLFCCFSVFWSINTAEAFYSSSKDLLGLLFFLICVLVLRRDPIYFLRSVFKIVLVLLSFTAIVITFQFLQADRSDPQWIYNLTGLNAHKNLCASFLFLLLFLIGFAIENNSGAWKKIYILALIICLALIFLLRSKAVFVGLIVSVITYFLTSKKSLMPTGEKSRDKKIQVGIYLIVLVFFLLILPSILRTTVTNNPVMEKFYNLDTERWILWQKSYTMFWKAPFFGVGAGNWQIYFPGEGLEGIWRSEDLNVSFQRPHNDFLWVLCEKGIFGFTLFILFVVGLIYCLIKYRNSPGDKNTTRRSSLFVSAMVGWLIISFCDFPAERIEHILLTNFFFALGYNQVRDFLPALFEFRVKDSLYAMAILVLFFCTIISWQRVTGERYTRDIYAAKAAGNVQQLYNAASNSLSFAYDLDPTTIPIRWYTGSALAAEGDYKTSLKHFEEAYDTHPFQRNVLNDLGTAYVLNTMPGKGKIYYTMATIVSPRFDDAKLNLAALALNERQFQLAEYWLRAVLHDSEKRRKYARALFIETDGKYGKRD